MLSENVQLFSRVGCLMMSAKSWDFPLQSWGGNQYKVQGNQRLFHRLTPTGCWKICGLVDDFHTPKPEKRSFFSTIEIHVFRVLIKNPCQIE